MQEILELILPLARGHLPQAGEDAVHEAQPGTLVGQQRLVDVLRVPPVQKVGQCEDAVCELARLAVARELSLLLDIRREARPGFFDGLPFVLDLILAESAVVPERSKFRKMSEKDPLRFVQVELSPLVIFGSPFAVGQGKHEIDGLGIEIPLLPKPIDGVVEAQVGRAAQRAHEALAGEMLEASAQRRAPEGEPLGIAQVQDRADEEAPGPEQVRIREELIDRRFELVTFRRPEDREPVIHPIDRCEEVLAVRADEGRTESLEDLFSVLEIGVDERESLVQMRRIQRAGVLRDELPRFLDPGAPLRQPLRATLPVENRRHVLGVRNLALDAAANEFDDCRRVRAPPGTEALPPGPIEEPPEGIQNRRRQCRRLLHWNEDPIDVRDFGESSRLHVKVRNQDLGLRFLAPAAIDHHSDSTFDHIEG